MAALVQAAKPGRELLCRAQNAKFTIDGKETERGVMSYYATLALEEADTVEDWVRRADRLCHADVERQKLSKMLRLSLRAAGEETQYLPGKPRR